MITNKPKDTRILWALFCSQFLSLVGSDVTKFALRVWVYRSTQSVSQYTLISFCAEAPALLLAPALGLAIDRLPRRIVLIVSDVLAALCTLVLALSGAPSPALVMVMNALSAILGAVHWSAFTASATLLVPSEALVRFGAFAQFAPALSMLFSPAIAGLVVEILGLNAAFIVEFVTCAVAALSLAAIELPIPATKTTSTGFLDESLAGLRFVLSTIPLRAMLVLQLIGYTTAAALQVLTMPLLLTFTDATTVGAVITASGCGAIIGTMIAAAIGPKLTHPALAVAVLQVVQGMLMVACAMRASTQLVLIVAFFFMMIVPTSRACREAVWQALAPPDILGRVLVLMQTLMQAMLPLTGALLGPLADVVFEPRLQSGGSWAGTVGVVVGTGPGRGCAALMAALGLCAIGLSLMCALCKGLRDITLVPAAEKVKTS